LRHQLRLLHLSDIHYSGYKGWDLDADLRKQVLSDVRDLVQMHGVLDGVLVGGDVAFSATTDEYQDARGWLAELCEVGGCAEAHVWTVPGNHDVDWSRITGSPMIDEFQIHMGSCEVAAIDWELRRRVGAEEHREVLVSPFSNYNDFALRYQCMTQAEAIAWIDEETLQLGPYPVHIVGLNSALISSARDKSASEPCMVVGTQQAALISRDSGAVSIVLCHHPPNWIRDWAQIEPYFLSRAQLVLFGHEHSYAAVASDRQVQIFAGAVHPDRGEHWVPAYNLVCLEVGKNDVLRVNVHSRQWDPDSTCFADDGTGSFEVPLAVTSAGGSCVDPGDPVPAQDPSTEHSAAAVTPARASGKEIFFRYLDLPRTTRLSIANGLELLETSDRHLPDDQLFPLLLRRADERGLVDKLDQEVNRVRPR
jgi:predicted MPP superfamily phosphohydrolase